MKLILVLNTLIHDLNPSIDHFIEMRKSYTKVPRKIQDKHDVSIGNSKEGLLFPFKEKLHKIIRNVNSTKLSGLLRKIMILLTLRLE